MNKGKIFTTAIVMLLPFGALASVTSSEHSSPLNTNSAANNSEKEKILSRNELLKIQEGENFIGSAGAKLSIIEYSSLECGHCAKFHNETFKKIKSEYIDKGLVNYTVRDFPLSKVGLAGAKLAHCAPKGRYFDFLNSLFESQAVWVSNNRYLESLLNIAKLGGISEEKFKECQEDEKLQNFIIKRAMDSSKILSIKSTPTFFIADKEINGEAPYSKFKEVLDSQLAN